VSAAIQRDSFRGDKILTLGRDGGKSQWRRSGGDRLIRPGDGLPTLLDGAVFGAGNRVDRDVSVRLRFRDYSLNQHHPIVRPTMDPARYLGGPLMITDRQTLSILQACAHVGVSRRTIYNWINSGKVEYVRTAGGAVRIFADSLWRSPGGDRPMDHVEQVEHPPAESA
jgi:excisionase family DNA binding protein